VKGIPTERPETTEGCGLESLNVLIQNIHEKIHEVAIIFQPQE
jgi:hypothetical protein